VVPCDPVVAFPSLPETYDTDRLRKYLNDHPGREANVDVMLKYLDAAANPKRPGRGKLSKQDQAMADEAASAARKLRGSEQEAAKIAGLGDAQPAVAQEGASQRSQRSLGRAASGSPPRRMLKKGRYESASSSASALVVTVPMTRKVSYRYTLEGLLRTRLVVVGPGAQSCSRRILKQMLPMAADLDIENCCFTLVAQLLDKLQPVLQVPTEIAATLKRCVQEREQICENDLRLGKEAGKHILNMVINGSGLPVGFTDNAFLKQLQTASRYLRWLACSLLPSVYESCKLNPQKTFPEASTFTYMWTAVEDTILASCVQFLLQHPVKHLSLHYDGVRVQGDFGCDVEALCTRCSEHIAASTGFVVVIREKKHYTFEEMLRAKAVELKSVSDVPDIYKGPGSCIPSALWCLAGDTQQIRDRLSDMSHPDNVVAQRRRCRSYRTVCSLTGRQLTPDLGLCLEEPGDYLLHAEGNGDPHCIAARVPESRTPIQVFTRNMVYSVDANTFKACFASAIDRWSVVTFRVGGHLHPDDSGLGIRAGLLDLVAGSNDECDFVFDAEPCMDTESESDGAEVPTSAAAEEEAVVHVGNTILRSMENEVALALERAQRRSNDNEECRCLLCPFRAFGKGGHRLRRLAQHLKGYHDRVHQFCCSGTKQLKVVIALHDADRFFRRDSTDLLKRSAELLRQTIVPPLSSKVNVIDRDIRLVFTSIGPKYMNACALGDQVCVRRVGNLYYTKEFGEILYRESMLHDSKVRAMLPRLHLRAFESNNPLAYLWPTHPRYWWPMLEDVFYSPVVTRLKSGLINDVVAHDGLECISVDATLRCCLSVMGQAHFRSSASTRAQAAFDDQSSKRRVLTVRGRTGAVLGMFAVQSEQAVTGKRRRM